jgi:hypothetical protein
MKRVKVFKWANFSKESTPVECIMYFNEKKEFHSFFLFEITNVFTEKGEIDW